MSADTENLRLYIKKAKRNLAAAKRDLDADDPENAISRAYYAAFTAIVAVLFERDLEFSSHGQIHGAFNRELIKSGEFPKEFGSIIYRLFHNRQKGDYSASFELSMKTAKRDYEDAKRILDACVEYLEKRTGREMK